MRVITVAALTMLALTAPATAQSLENGEDVFKKCRACHAVGPSAKNMVGPLLNGLEGRKAGTIAGFNYTEANKSSGFTWDAATFAKYIKDPRGVIPGTKMVFAGIKDETDIKDLWAYLKQFQADGSIKK
jgi:cytochrome c